LAAVGADDRGTYGAEFALGAIVGPVIGERPDSMPLAAVFNYQIVVRLADGSRVVFNEPTARTLQAGDHIVVIAGVPAAVLRSSERTLSAQRDGMHSGATLLWRDSSRRSPGG
jgi:outer membrane lipoprotein SlyB